ncbi:MAG: Smr/MutS family protein [Oligoflexia bacterium]|nr:Smr/MutS family protein [Oligoflexia bacterium]
MFKELDWPELLHRISSNAFSEAGKKLCLQVELLKSIDKAHESFDQVLAAQEFIDQIHQYSFEAIDFTAPIYERLKKHASLELSELIILRKMASGAQSVKNIIKGKKGLWLESLNKGIGEFRDQLSAINHVISPEGEINEDASPTLAALCDERRRLKRDISKTLDQVISKRQMEAYLQDRYVTNREGRMVIPVKSGSQHDVKGLIHDASQTKQTVFIEPEEVVPLNNKLRETQILIEAEILRILKELSDYLGRHLTLFKNATESMTALDVRLAQAKFTKSISGNCARLTTKGDFNLVGVRHPILMAQGINVVPNTVKLNSQKRILILSGPNAGGKTVLLKSIGLACLMANSGLPIAAEAESSLPLLNTIDPVVGDLQSVGEHLSTFSSHIQRVSNATKHQGLETLVLVDEICGATDPEEGAALAKAFIDHFCEQEVFAIITSHLGPLKEQWTTENPIVQGSLEFNRKTNKPTFQLLIGIPGRSLALSVAESFGVPQKVLKKALAYLAPESLQKSKELSEIESLKDQILELKAQTVSDRDEANKSKLIYQELVKKFREQRDKWLEKALQKAEKKVEDLIEQARQQRLRDKTLVDIRGELPEIIKGRSTANRPQTIEEFKTAFPPGSPVYSSRLGRQVVIQSAPDNKGQVMVLADSLRVALPWHSLTASQPSETKPTTSIRRPANLESLDSDEDSTLDLRGNRIDEALSRLEKWLDDCIRTQKDHVKIIHGFGTEQLKKALRQHLSKSRYVDSWKAGDKDSGGDGVTWIKIADL